MTRNIDYRGQVVVWAPNARGGGGRTSLRHLVRAFGACESVEGVVAVAPPGVLDGDTERVIVVDTLLSRLRAEFTVLRLRSAGVAVIAPLNFAPIGGCDVLYQRNALYFEASPGLLDRSKRLQLAVRRFAAVLQSRRSKHVVVPSEHMKRITAAAGVPEEKIEVVPHGVPISFESPMSHQLPPEWRSARLRLLWVGVPTAQKNLTVLADLMACLPDSRRRDGILLVTCGPNDTTFSAELERRARELGVTDQILFAGALEHELALQAMAVAHCVVLPSLIESFGLPVIEALASGCRVVVSPGGCLPEFRDWGAIVADGWTGHDFASAVLQATDRALLGPGAESVRHHFSWDRHAGEVVRLLRN